MQANVPLRILLVEDNPAIAKMMQIFLRIKGCEVMTVIDGEQALERWDTGDYDLILMDVHLPKMSGFDVAAVIREREETRDSHIPIIAMSAHLRQDDADKCLAAGMDGYLAKPTNPEVLYQEIQQTLRSLRRF